MPRSCASTFGGTAAGADAGAVVLCYKLELLLVSLRASEHAAGMPNEFGRWQAFGQGAGGVAPSSDVLQRANAFAQ